MNVLISGAGIAGNTLAWWLTRQGHRVTVVEYSTAQRSSGAPVDVRGAALAIVDQMGLIPRLRAAATHVDGMAFVTRSGRTSVRVETSALQRAAARGDIEVPRGALSTALQEANGDSVEFLFGDSIAGLVQDPGGVDVTFEHGRPRRFELVIGADGLRSGVRRIAFGPEDKFISHLGLYVATAPLSGSEPGRDIVMFNAPGRSATIHPSHGSAVVAFIFWSPKLELHHRDVEGQRAILQRFYGADGWRVPELLSAARASDALYFDGVSRVQTATWSKGRVALVGDAASCVSLFGNGSSLAISGAHTLATALAESPLESAAALARYEQRHRRFTDRSVRTMSLAASLVTPSSSVGIALRNQLLHLWPLAAAVSRVTSFFRRPQSDTDKACVGP